MLDLVKRSRCFGGWNEIRAHRSQVTGTLMRCAVYLPPQARERRCPVVYVLSGLTCNEENFVTKAGAQRQAAELGLILVAPDTSPRGAGVPGEDASWDIGTGAGFYVNATQQPWATHYRMYDYVLEELPALVREHLPSDGRQSIMGHSMGGHGALVLGLRHPERYAAISAFAPICAPRLCPWGVKAFSTYLGTDTSTWDAYDASALVAQARQHRPLLVDQGLDDEFLVEQLQPERLEEACFAADYPLTLRRHAGYDHSYYFITTFIDDHLRHHAQALEQVGR